jgi:hypothetical protein
MSRSKVPPEDKKISKQLLNGGEQAIGEFVLIAQEAMATGG